jgi:pyruvate dehydrogenase E2 component (dihydrolipoamide acetyltransferase)
MPFLIKAVVAALKNHPIINSSLDVEKNEIVLHGHYDIGIAAATDQGLVVPVVHGADKLSIFELAAEVQRLGQKARSGQLSREDLSGSTFTITSLGKQAGLFAVPIINFPNVGILGIHRIKERPVVKNGQIAIGQIMLLSLSLDHRLVDGHVGAAFAYDVIAGLEAPARLLVD